MSYILSCYILVYGTYIVNITYGTDYCGLEYYIIVEEIHMNDENIIDVHNLLVGIDSKVITHSGDCIKAINFDNAATTPPFKGVIDYIIKLSDYYGSIGRGAGHKAEITTRIYNDSKNKIMDFFNINEKENYTVIYVNNTTDGINKLARILLKDKSDIVLTTRMEHHSNDLPWRRHGTVDYIEVDELGRIKINELETKLIEHKGRIRFVSVTGASNVTGYINDIHKIAKIAHKYGAKIIVDGAQIVPHKKVDMLGKCKEEKIDFLVFSGHKVYAPFGAGVIIGLKRDFEESLPDNEGGGIVNHVLDWKVEYLSPPEKEEAGTPNFFGAISIQKSLEQLDEIGFDKLFKHEEMLRNKVISGLTSIPKIINYGDIYNIDDRLGIGVFNIIDMYHQEVAESLAQNYGISVRQGWFCAHPYCRRLMHMSDKVANTFAMDSTTRMPGMIRASFGIYNTEEEVDTFLEAIEEISKGKR